MHQRAKCIKCDSEFFTKALKPECPKCGTRRVNYEERIPMTEKKPVDEDEDNDTKNDKDDGDEEDDYFF